MKKKLCIALLSAFMMSACETIPKDDGIVRTPINFPPACCSNQYQNKGCQRPTASAELQRKLGYDKDAYAKACKAKEGADCHKWNKVTDEQVRNLPPGTDKLYADLVEEFCIQWRAGWRPLE